VVNADATVTLRRAALDAILSSQMTLIQTVASGQLKIAGNSLKFMELFSLLDTFKPDFDIVVP
jgi:alkyl sulfatase BDS1-like metallo-beta-lactamase superfamily hydrolase